MTSGELNPKPEDSGLQWDLESEESVLIPGRQIVGVWNGTLMAGHYTEEGNIFVKPRTEMRIFDSQAITVPLVERSASENW